MNLRLFAIKVHGNFVSKTRHLAILVVLMFDDN